LNEPSAEAAAKFTDHCEQFHTYPFLLYLLNHRSVIPYISEDQADAATKNPNLKLLFRLSKFYILDEGEGLVIGFG
jgi:replication fork protection complex subunit Tof1/Swi1